MSLSEAKPRSGWPSLEAHVPAPVWRVSVIVSWNVSLLFVCLAGGWLYHVYTIETYFLRYSGAEAIVHPRRFDDVLFCEQLSQTRCCRDGWMVYLRHVVSFQVQLAFLYTLGAAVEHHRDSAILIILVRFGLAVSMRRYFIALQACPNRRRLHQSATQ